MKIFLGWYALLFLVISTMTCALDGEPFVHDPSTVIAENGRYYSFGTGRDLPILTSEDGWNWQAAGTVMSHVPGGKPGPEVLTLGGNNTWAPDLIFINDSYYLYYSAPGQQPKSAIGLLTASTLNPDSPNYGWRDQGPVVWSDGVEDLNAIDPGVFHDPTNNTLWLSYGSYFGFIKLVQLNPKTGLRLYPKKDPINIAINSEASIIIYRDGWYYLLVTHGSCCRGANSSYNIRMGRSKKVTGPYLDNMGIDMLQGGGKLFLGSGNRLIGPGHFGLLDLGDGVEKFSLHYEADLDRGGRSVLDIRPLLWRDHWPVAGENMESGIYQIESVRTGTVLELAVEGEPVGGMRPPGPPRPEDFQNKVIPDQDAKRVSVNWPEKNLDVRMSPYMLQAQQKWEITAVKDAGGYPGSPYFKISIADTGYTLAATKERELIALPSFTGAAEQLWRIDQLVDGTYRIMPKAIPGVSGKLVLSAVGSSTPSLGRFEPDSERQRWYIKKP